MHDGNKTSRPDYDVVAPRHYAGISLTLEKLFNEIIVSSYEDDRRAVTDHILRATEDTSGI